MCFIKEKLFCKYIDSTVTDLQENSEILFLGEAKGCPQEANYGEGVRLKSDGCGRDGGDSGSEFSTFLADVLNKSPQIAHLVGFFPQLILPHLCSLSFYF